MTRRPTLPLLLVGALLQVAPACSTTSPTSKATTPSLSEAFGFKCDAMQPQQAPDLMAWDSAARANLDRLRKQGPTPTSWA